MREEGTTRTPFCSITVSITLNRTTTRLSFTSRIAMPSNSQPLSALTAGHRRSAGVLYRARGAAGPCALHSSAPIGHRGSVRALRRGRPIVDPLPAETSDDNELAG